MYNEALLQVTPFLQDLTFHSLDPHPPLSRAARIQPDIPLLVATSANFQDLDLTSDASPSHKVSRQALREDDGVAMLIPSQADSDGMGCLLEIHLIPTRSERDGLVLLSTIRSSTSKASDKRHPQVGYTCQVVPCC